jgi:DNA invertase Pin-like site-specific DNA recombinase
MSEQEKRQRKPAIGYMRTSSAANVGEGKDSEARQRRAIQAYANKAGYRIVEWHSDPAVSGADHIEARPGFAAALERIASNGVRTIIVETANRFARDLMVQEAGYARLQDARISLIAADKPDSFTDDSPTAVMVRQILGAVAQFDKAMTVAKLRGARQRKRRLTGKCEGRKSLAETVPAAVALARDLHRAQPRPSLRAIAAELALAGHKTSNDTEYSVQRGRNLAHAAEVSLLHKTLRGQSAARRYRGPSRRASSGGLFSCARS